MKELVIVYAYMHCYCGPYGAEEALAKHKWFKHKNIKVLLKVAARGFAAGVLHLFSQTLLVVLVVMMVRRSDKFDLTKEI